MIPMRNAELIFQALIPRIQNVTLINGNKTYIIR